MRVLYHHRTRAGDAQGIHIFELMRALRGLGHQVHEVALVSAGKDEDRPARRSALGAAASLVPRRGYEFLEILYNLIGRRRLSRVIRDFRPDFIYERYALYNFAGVLASRRHGLPLLLEVNAPLALERSEELTLRRLARKSEKWICSNSFRTICVSNELKRILEQDGVPGPKLEICHNGVNPDEFHGRDTGARVRQKYQLNGKTVLGFVGWIRDWHGLDKLVPCLRRWRDRGSNIDLLIIGDGPARTTIETAASECGVGDAVHITGAVKRSEVVDHLAALDIALQPASTPYASPMKIFEYLAMGKPVVAPRQANILEIVRDEHDAMLFRPGDPLDMERAVDELLDKPSLAERLGIQARRTVFERKFLWTENAQRVIRIAEECLGKSGHPSRTTQASRAERYVHR